jgi:hypothetical protein
VAGTVLHDGPELEVIRIDAPVRPRHAATASKVAVAFAWSAFVGLPLAGLLAAARRRKR